MSGARIDAPGVDTFVSALGVARAELDDFTTPSRAAAADVLAAVVPPVDTGRLASTVVVDAGAHGFVLNAGGPGAPYAPYVHAYDPFLIRAVDAREGEVIDHVADHVDTTLDTLTS